MSKHQHLRVPIIRAVLCLALGLAIALTALSNPLRDFIEYWAVGHIFVNGENCYSLPGVYTVERALGWNEPVPLMVLNPPWALPILAPLGILTSYSLGWVIWICFMAASVAASSFLLLDLYADDVHLPGISDSHVRRSLFILSFYPTLLCLRFAQITPLVLLGIVGFLWLQEKKCPALAGVALALALFKPQLIYLVTFAVLATSIQRRSARTIIGLASFISALIFTALLFNPGVLRDYWELSTGPYVQLYPSAVGAIFRFPFGGTNRFWMQFVPPIAGTGWFLLQWKRRRHDWNWLQEMPILIAVSVLTTAYGWLFDQALLAIPVVAMFAVYARRFGTVPKKTIVIYSAVNAVLILGAMLRSSWCFVFPIAPAIFAYAVSVSPRFNQVTVNPIPE